MQNHGHGVRSRGLMADAVRVVVTMPGLTALVLALLCSAAPSQGQGVPARLSVNGQEMLPLSPPMVVGAEVYMDGDALASFLGLGVAVDNEAARFTISHFGTELVLAHEQPAAAGGVPVGLFRMDGRLLAPLTPLARAFGFTFSVQPGSVVEVTAPRPTMRALAYEETDAAYRVTIELSSPGLFQAKWAGTDVVLTLPVDQAFIPPGMTSLGRDMRGHAQPVTAPANYQYELTGPLARSILIANTAGPAVRIGLQNNYRVHDARLHSLGGPPRIVVELNKLYSESESQVIAPGIEYRTMRLGKGFGPVVAHCVFVDPTVGPYKTTIVSAGSTANVRRTVSAIAQRAGALVAINGGYFDTGSGFPLGLVIDDAEWVRLPMMQRTSLLVLEDGRLAIGNVSARGSVQLPSGRVVGLTGLNQWLPGDGSDALVAHTPRWGPTYTSKGSTHVAVANGRITAVADVAESGEVPIPQGGLLLSASGGARQWLQGLAAGQAILVTLQLDPPVPGVREALGAGPRLVHQGQPWVTQAFEKFRTDVTSSRAPRTALGLAANGLIIFVVVDGRAPGHSAGMYLDELAQLMISLGAVEAMAFDAGGSATLFVGGRIVNRPSDGNERAVPNVVAVVR